MALRLRRIRRALMAGLLSFSALRAVRYWDLYNSEVNGMERPVRKIDEEFVLTIVNAKCAPSLDPSQCSARAIVQNAYDRAYRPFVDRCQPGMPYVEGCIMNATDKSSPWWLAGLFRDSGHAFRRNYHELLFHDPKLRFCRIEKIASSRWYRIFAKYNEEAKVVGPEYGWREDTDGADAPQVVFVRDPLERFLSAFIDKCVKLKEKGMHCQPVSDELREIRSGYSKRQAFESYIHTFPLEWNVHFVPQALYCDGLFRTIQNYSFVGSMQDDRFVQDLFRLMATYPGKFMDYVQNEFNFSPNAANFRDELDKPEKKPNGRLKKRKGKHHTGSTQKVLDYYDADTVRQVLQYYAIDYVTLNLEIPEWVQEVLDRDCHQRFRARSVVTGTGS